MEPPTQKVFISYSHKQGPWVWGRLKPCLEAGGAEVLIDRERFDAGKAAVGQMDALQDQADVSLLLLSHDYLKSDYCRHEMDRAVARDPGFQDGRVIPVQLDDCKLPQKIAGPDPLYVDLQDDKDEKPWDLLMRACGADLGATPSNWLKARDDVVRWLQGRQSVNLLVGQRVKWQPLIRQIRETAIPDLKIVDLESAATASRRGLLTRILAELGVKERLPDKPEDLVRFDSLVDSLPAARLALVHFHYVRHRNDEYGLDFFVTLRNLTITKRKLALLIQSREPFASLLPPDNPLSAIDVKSVELGGRP